MFVFFRRLTIPVLLFFVCCCVYATDKTGIPPKKVLITVSCHMTHSWTSEIVSSLQKNTADLKYRVDYNIVEMDVLRVPDASAQELDFKRQLPLLRDGKYDMLVVVGDPAVELAKKYYSVLPPDMPVMYVGYENFVPSEMKKYPSMTGFVMQYDFASTVRLGLNLYPDTVTVYVYSDHSPESQALESKLKKDVPRFKGVTIKFIENDKLSITQTFSLLRKIPGHSLVVLMPWRELYNNDYQTLEAMGTDLSKVLGRPFLVNSDVMFGNGALGGYISDAGKLGASAAEMLEKIFKSGVAEVPTARCEIEPVVDYDVIKDNGLDAGVLPSGTVMRNKPPSFWRVYLPELVSVGLVIATLLLSAFLYMRISRRVMKRSLRLYSRLPGRVGVMNRKEKILFISDGDGSGFEIGKAKTLKDMPFMDYGKMSRIMREVFETKQNITIEYAYNNVKRYMTIAPLDKDIFGEESIVWFSHDNTDLQDARRQIEETAEYLSLTLKSIGDGVLVTDPDGRVTMMNPVAERLTGYTKDEASGRPHEEIFRIVSYTDGSQTPSPLAQALKTGEKVELANCTDLIAGNGERHHIADSAAPIRNAAGKIIGAILVFRDVTEEYNKRDALRDALRAFEYSSELSMQASFRLDPATRKITGSALIDKLWHMDENGQATFHDAWVAEQDVPKFNKAFESLFSGKKDSVTLDFRSNKESGLRYYRIKAGIEWSNSVLHSDMIVGVIQDVTDITTNAMRLKETVELWNLIIERIPVMIFAKDVENDFRYVITNPFFEDFIAKTTGEIIGHTDSEIFAMSEQSAAPFIQKDREIIENDRPETFLEYPVDGHGRQRSLRTIKMPFTASDGKKLLLGVTVDLTDIETSRKKLEEARALWDTVINAIPFMFFAKKVDDDFRYLLTNSAFANFSGLEPGDVIGRTDSEIFSDAGDVAHFLEDDMRIVASGKSCEFEEASVDHNGIKHHIHTIKCPFVTPSGERLLLGASTDVTRLHNLIESERLTNSFLSEIVLEQDFNKVLAKVAAELHKQTGCARALIARTDEKGHLRFYYEWHAASEPEFSETLDFMDHYELWDEKVGEIAGGQIIKIPDVMTSPVTKALYAGSGLDTRSVIAAPVMHAGKLWGAIVLTYSGNIRVFSDIDEDILRSTANIISIAIMRDEQNVAVNKANYEKRMILNNIKIPIWLYDAEGKLLQVNTAVERLAGISESEKLSSHENIDIFCTDVSPDQRPVIRAMRTRRTVRSEITFHGRDYMVDAEPVFDDAGELLYVVKSAVDVTDLNNLLDNQQIINVSLENFFDGGDMTASIDEFLHTVAEHAGASRAYILKFDTGARRVEGAAEYSAAGEKIIAGVSAEFDAESKWFAGLGNGCMSIAADVAAAEETELDPLVKKENARSIYDSGVMVDGRLWGVFGIMYEKSPVILSSVMMSFAKSAAHLVEVMLERKEAQEKLISALHQAQNADKAKSYFIASVSHELRTPLNAVIGFSELLKNDSTLDFETRNEYLESISSSGNALLQLINDVLDLSKLEAGQMAIVPQSADFRELCSEMTEIFRFRTDRKGLILSANIGDMPRLMVDRLRLRQVLFNLVGNAVKFTQRGAITITASYIRRTGAKGGLLRFSVTDTGCGIADADAKRLFEPFVQLSGYRGTNASNSGTGLGLAISKRLIERMNGRMSLSSRVGKGSCFSVEIYDVLPAESESAENGAPADTVSVSARSLDGINALIVDDVSTNLRVLEAMLVRIGLKCEKASSGDEALRKLRESRFDIVITDMWMPGMNGSELAKNIRDDEKLKDIPVAAVTADVEAQVNFKTDIFAGMLFKPVTTEKLRAMLLAIFGGKQA